MRWVIGLKAFDLGHQIQSNTVTVLCMVEKGFFYFIFLSHRQIAVQLQMEKTSGN